MPLTIDQQFAQAARRRDAAASIRWKAFEAALYADGAADRAVLGIPDAPAPVPINQASVLGAAWAAIQNGIEQFARDFNAGFRAIRPNG